MACKALPITGGRPLNVLGLKNCRIPTLPAQGIEIRASPLWNLVSASSTCIVIIWAHKNRAIENVFENPVRIKPKKHHLKNEKNFFFLDNAVPGSPANRLLVLCSKVAAGPCLPAADASSVPASVRAATPRGKPVSRPAALSATVLYSLLEPTSQNFQLFYRLFLTTWHTQRLRNSKCVSCSI